METANSQKVKKERTIRSETTKVFLVIFCILMTIGIFTVFATAKGASTFTNISGVYVKQFQATEVLKQRALEIIGIFYLLGSDQDINILMTEMQRYDSLTGQFDQAIKDIKESLVGREKDPANAKVGELLAKTKDIFDKMNDNCRQMTIALMEGKKEEGSKSFKKVQEDIATFKGLLDEIETIVIGELNSESNKAKGLLSTTTWAGILLTFFGVLITIGLIYYLMKFLSISLLPISNLMHNMRQAVFSIDKSMKIISPVSKYSNVVFNTEIVEKDIADVVFKDLNPEGEVVSKAKFVMKTVFGEDELQWSLSESDLPGQVKIKSGANGEAEKILKLTYTPLWDKEQKVQNIMIVAEDVTEIERLREEALKKQGEIGIVQALIGMAKADVEPFLNEFQEKIAECRSLLLKLEVDREARLLLFRILHTLKGNARMYNFNSISEIIHITENTVVSINTSIDSGEGFAKELYAKIEEGFDKTEASLAFHFKMANKLFGIKDRYASHNEEKLQQSMTDLELFYDRAKKEPNFNMEGVKYLSVKSGVVVESIAEIDKSVKTAWECSKYYENKEFTECLERLNTEVTSKSESWKNIYKNVREKYLNFINQAEFVKSYDMDMTKWISVLQKSFAVVQAFEKYEKKANSDTMGELEKEILSLYEVIDTERLLFLKLQAIKTLNSLKINSADHVQTVKRELQLTWSYLLFILNVDVSYNLDADSWKKLKGIYLGLKDANNSAKDDLAAFSSTKILSLSFFRSLYRKDSSPMEFINWIRNFYQLSSVEAAVNMIMGDSQNVDKIERLFLLLKENSLESDKGNSYLTSLESSSLKAFSGFLKEHIDSIILSNDLIRLLSVYVKSHHSSQKDSTNDMIEIPLVSYNELKTQLEELNNTSASSKDDAVKRLNMVFNSLFDQPVKSICYKMEPMVKDLAKRLDKDVEFVVAGDDIYLNRDKVYSLRDALVHLIRNSLDHGVETPSERESVGKLPKALIEINCKKRGEELDIIVKDDGRGINAEKVVSKAIAKGLLSPETAKTLTEEQRLALIFLPNLSTKDEVTAVSGRGVGMDAVKDTIEKLGGKINLKSQVNIGTELTLTIVK